MSTKAGGAATRQQTRKAGSGTGAPKAGRGTAARRGGHASADKDALARLLAPITPREFFDDYWGRRPLFIKGGAAKLERLLPGGFGPAEFFNAARRSAEMSLKHFKVWASDYEAATHLDPDARLPYVAIPAERMEEMFARGANVLAENFCEDRLAQFSADLKTRLGHAGDVSCNATVSPSGRGFPPHLDRTSAFFLQAHGRKCFLISPGPVTEWPRGSASFAPDGSVASYDYDAELSDEFGPVDVSNLTEVMLEPGDVLYIPAGTIHATKATGGECLNINLLFDHASFFQLVSRALESLLRSNPAWRHLPEVAPARAADGELPAEMRQFFAARLDELRETVGALRPDSAELNQQWRKSLADPGEPLLATLPPATKHVGRVRRADRFRLTRRVPLAYARGTDEDGDPTFTIYCGSKEVAVAGEWVPFLGTLVGQDEFGAGDATLWAGGGRRYPWAVVREYMEALLELSVIETTR